MSEHIVKSTWWYHPETIYSNRKCIW